MKWTKEIADEIIRLYGEAQVAADAVALASKRSSDAGEKFRNALVAFSGQDPESITVSDAQRFNEGYAEAEAKYKPPSPPEKTWSKLTTPTRLQRMHFDGNVLFVSDEDINNGGVLYFDLPALPYGTEFDVQFTRARDFKGKWAAPANIKPFRVWKGAAGSKPNFYVGTQADGNTIVYPELVPLVTAKKDAAGWNQWGRAYFPYPAPDGHFHRERYQWRANSSTGKADGWIRISLDDKIVFEADNWITDSTDTPGVANVVCIQDIIANDVFPAGSTIKVEANTISVKWAVPA